MKIYLKDFLTLAIIFSIWYALICYLYINNYFTLYSSLKYFPMHLIVTLGYYAIISVSYKILFIGDCKKEYHELLSEIEESREFFRKNNINININ